MPKFIIETVEKPTRYWYEQEGYSAWIGARRLATEFADVARTRMTLPAGGCWVQVDEPSEATLQQAMRDTEHLDAPAIRQSTTHHHFTTIKLRPVVIRLSTTDGEYEDLNAQALEFEAALRQWVKRQQILTDDWMVDVIEEE